MDAQACTDEGRALRQPFQFTERTEARIVAPTETIDRPGIVARAVHIQHEAKSTPVPIVVAIAQANIERDMRGAARAKEWNNNARRNRHGYREATSSSTR